MAYRYQHRRHNKNLLMVQQNIEKNYYMVILRMISNNGYMKHVLNIIGISKRWKQTKIIFIS